MDPNVQKELERLEAIISSLQSQQQSVSIRDISDKFGFLITTVVPGVSAATAANYGIFFTAPVPMNVVWIGEKHGTANASASSIQVQSVLDNGAATSILSTAFDLTATANKAQTASAYQGNKFVTGGGNKAFYLNKKDSLKLTTTGTLNTLAQVVITVYLNIYNQGRFFTIY